MREERVKEIARIQEKDRNKLYQSIIQKNERLNDFQLKKLKIIEQKKKMQDEIIKKKEIYNQKFQQIISRRGFDNKSMKIIKKMFPDNEKINELIQNFRSGNFKKARALSQNNVFTNMTDLSKSRDYCKNSSRQNSKIVQKKNKNNSTNLDNINNSLYIPNNNNKQFSLYLTSIDSKKNILTNDNNYNSNNNIKDKNNNT